MNKKFYLTAIVTFLYVALGYSQSNFGEIRGKLIDDKTKKPLDFVNLILEFNGQYKTGTSTDDNGNYYFKTLNPGKYTIKATNVGYTNVQIDNIQVNSEQITFLNIEMSAGKELAEFVKKEYKVPIVKQDENSRTISAEQIKKIGTRSVNQIANTAAGVVSINGGTPSFRGSRADGTAYYIDGVRVIGSTTLPQAAQEQINIIQGGVPAQYGDFTGGAISITTRGPSKKYVGSFELISSNLTDKFQYNQAEGMFAGPLKIINKGKAGKERVLLGFSLTGNINYLGDSDPSAIGSWVVNDAKLREIEQNPLVPTPSGRGFVSRSAFLRMSDLENRNRRENNSLLRGVAQGKVEYQPTANTNVTVFGSVNLSENNLYSFSHSLLNYGTNPQRLDNTYRTYIRFTQKLKTGSEEGGKKPVISNAWYSVRFDYTSRNITTQDARHKDNIFDYGYIGEFNRYQAAVYAPQFNEGPDSKPKMFVDQNGDTVFLRSYWEQVGFRDTLFTFKRAEINPLKANYTSNYFNSVPKVTNQTEVQQNLGLLNGFDPQNIYSLWFNPGTNRTAFNKAQNERYTLFATGEATVNTKKSGNKHDLQFGLMYEQSVNRSYGLNANGLWQLMPQLVNTHIASLDTTRPFLSYDANGVFQDTVSYERMVQYESQTKFDRSLRDALKASGYKDVNGKPIGEKSFIDVNALSPEQLKLSFFSADELLNNGNSYVSYSGYDYLGNKVKGKPSIDEFINNKEKRTIGAYMPIYNAVWVQDKFAFKDLIFRLGLRVERFDANQPVLKDPYSLFPIKTAGEVSTLNNKAVVHPGNIGDDYAVYVNNMNNPTQILGYRKNDAWFNSDGTAINNPDLIAIRSPLGIQPFLLNPVNPKLSSNSFVDYTPQINALPRIWFSFPISTVAQFFANYDVLAQRPPDGITFATIDDYFYMINKSNQTFANPSLRPRIKTDYEIGFKQQIGDNSGLSLIASYSEIRNDFNQFRYNQAFPISYTSYSNIDFSTIKGFRTEYELRDAGDGNLNLNVNYMLQFADGTGSNANSAAVLIQAQQPNLRSLFPLDIDIRHNLKAVFDYRYAQGDKYNGPIVNGKKIFENTGTNFIIFARSGAPFTATDAATAEAQRGLGTVTRSRINGTVFGSRMPWQFSSNMTLDKSFTLKMGADNNNKQKMAQLNVFVWIENLTNAKNVVNVYQYTGLPDDDGYLNSPQGQQAIQNQTDSQSFVDLYKIRMNNPDNFVSPRLIRLGARLIFN